MAIKHNKVSGIADGEDATLVRPSDWNADHTLGTGEIIPLIIRKTADETVNNSTTLQNDDHLLFAVAANEVWVVEFLLLYISGTVPDFKCAIVLPTGGILTGMDLGKDYAGNTTIGVALTAGGAVVFEGGGQKQIARIKAVVTIGGTAGNIQLQWAQNTAAVSDTIVYANSCIIAHKLT